MEAYLTSLGQNDILISEWNQLKLTTHKYDPNYNYYSELLSYELAENKRSEYPIKDNEFPGFLADRIFNYKRPTRTIGNYCPSCRQYTCGKYCVEDSCKTTLTPDEMKERVYIEWLSHKYKNFKKNWKPKQDDGLNYIWLTINFAPDVSVHQAQLHVASIFSLAIFNRTKITYCYEYNTKAGNHIHVHALIEMNSTGTISFSSLKDDILRAKSRQGKLNIYLKMSWARKYEDRCDNRAVYLAYLNGNKVSEKIENTEKDKLWRSENGLQELYIRENK